ncbi:PREDICTED: F-box/kelch-repeat protein At3g06240-like [Fragaria vesca subsp. vesca]|uniref:F-box/kelch-repeat protein At3g06240-like n=1 Tax=Fragaria vesca subsp. vesca TaxID=101020 RepID=UPI0002C342B5|nr:PREDICTED: F-box/kelch-repeat protein At3g06240-like [Fragaria vesca subsp. vesca]
MEVGSEKQKTEDGGQNVDLPPEIIDAILSRLPVKSLCRFKLVSKSWQSLISDLDFVANYSKATIENMDVLFRRRPLLFTLMDSEPSQGMYSLDLDQFLNENPNAGVDGLVATPSELDFVYNHLPNGIDWFPFALYSCHGLFLSHLWSGDFSVNLIDPLTKESKTIPEPPKWRLGFGFGRYLHGFGFDHSINEYKVINGQHYDDGVMFSVYTLQIGSWRQIDCLFP